jgi:hypothetical protein
MDPVTLARQDAQLGFIQQYLTNAGITTQMLERSEELPISVLVLPLVKDERQRDRYLQLSFVPLDEDDLGGIDLLQIYATVPVEWNGNTKESVARLLAAINGKLAIGHFNLQNDEVCYRYVHCVSGSNRIPEEETLAVIQLFETMLNMFASLVDDVASGRTGLSQALSRVEG